MKKIIIHTDGAAIPNPGKGGAGIILNYCGFKKELSVYLGENITNNAAELLAAIHALKALKEPCEVTIITDSQWLANCANGDWSRKSNRDIWHEYDHASQNHKVTFEWQRKDTSIENKRAHILANEAIK
jgi:ribonuclease HI